MASDPPATIPRWTAPDLLDFDAMLAADETAAGDELRRRDRGIAEEVLLPALGERLTPGASTADRGRALRLWLEERRRQRAKATDLELSPGEAFSHSRAVVGFVLGAISLLAGIGAVLSVLNRDQRYFNIVLFLAVTLLPQLALLALLGIGWLVQGRRPEKAAGFFQVLARRAVEALSEKGLTRKVGETAASSWRALRRRPYLGWPIAAATQSAAVLFNVGLLLAFFGCLAVLDLRFFWESTPSEAASQTLKSVVDTLALPWAWALPDFVPSYAEIEATRISTADGLTEKTDSAAAWAPFLLMSLATWGLLPRLLLRLAIGAMGRRSLRGYTFSERPHRELWRRLTEVRVESPISGQRDDAVVLLWGGTDPETEHLRTALLQQVRWNPVETLAVGGLDLQADQRAVEVTVDKLRAADRPIRIALVADAWALVPRDLEPFLRQLREAIGGEVRVLAFLLGAASDERPDALAAPSAEEVRVWESFAADLDDAQFAVQPFRPSEPA